MKPRAKLIAPGVRREQVRELVILGGTNKAIARQLGISEGTVKTHVTAILLEAECTHRSEYIVKIWRARVEALTDPVIQPSLMESPR